MRRVVSSESVVTHNPSTLTKLISHNTPPFIVKNYVELVERIDASALLSMNPELVERIGIHL